MSKLVKQVLQVEEDDRGWPVRVRSSGLWFRVVEVLDRWYDTGRWWEGELPRLFFRLRLEGSRLWEIYQDQKTRSWHLYKIYD